MKFNQGIVSMWKHLIKMIKLFKIIAKINLWIINLLYFLRKLAIKDKINDKL